MGDAKRYSRESHRGLGMWSIRLALAVAFGTAAVLLIAAWFLVSWLLGAPRKTPPQPLDTTAQLELIKIVLGLVAGVGALVALVTAYRRQRVEEAAGERAERIQAHAEQVARDNAHDATERRVTDLYCQAVEQLGHDKAAVRLGGLYSLERLAQDHPQHRQTVIDVVCAYLRMPFEPSRSADGLDGDVQARQELQARLGAQRLLFRHLTVTEPSEEDVYWARTLIDLTGAHLVDFDFTRCRPHRADFRNARFTGIAGFSGAEFIGEARFHGVEFRDAARFGGALFHEDAGFGGAQFSGDAGFSGATFGGIARFDGAQFAQAAGFSRARFGGQAGFGGAMFGGDARFDEAYFAGTAGFTGVTFGKTVGFKGARFDANVRFHRGIFRSDVRFEDVVFKGDSRFDGSRFCGNAAFGRAEFIGPVGFEDVQFDQDAGFGKARFATEANFSDARFGGTAWFDKSMFVGHTLYPRVGFIGTAWFQEATFAWNPDLTDATADSPGDQHVWPPGWQVEPAVGKAPARLAPRS
ncbi:hypothetical protein GCM10029978_008600 [Actinoallomurus acanthiterrae]